MSIQLTLKGKRIQGTVGQSTNTKRHIDTSTTQTTLRDKFRKRVESKFYQGFKRYQSRQKDVTRRMLPLPEELENPVNDYVQ